MSDKKHKNDKKSSRNKRTATDKVSDKSGFKPKMANKKAGEKAGSGKQDRARSNKARTGSHDDERGRVAGQAPQKRMKKGDLSKKPHDHKPIEGGRIAKVMARAGLCSRRDAERWIEAGRVSVNGKILETPALVVGPKDKIKVDGKPLDHVPDTQLYIYNKPVGLVVSHKDEQGRKTVFDSLSDKLPRLISVGRLDINSEGLLLLTNDGGLARYLEHPSSGWVRQYRVRVLGNVTENKLQKLEKGINVEGVRYGPIKAKLDDARDKTEGKPNHNERGNTWLLVSLKEGKNREVRKAMEYIGLTVNRLIRVSYGPFLLGSLNKGQVDHVPERVLHQHFKAYFEKGTD